MISATPLRNSGISFAVLVLSWLASANPAEAQTKIALDEARRRFAAERKAAPGNGLYDDFRAQFTDGAWWFPKYDSNAQPIAGSGSRITGLGIKSADLGPCEISSSNQVTHLLARDLTEPMIREALTNKHMYVANDWLCDPTSFMFGAINNLGVFTMGDLAPMLGKTRLVAITPLSAKLRLLHNDSVVQETTGTNLTFEATEPGPYRIEASLTVDGQDRPWICSSAVNLRAPNGTDMQLPAMDLSPEVEAHKNLSYRDGPEAEAAKHKLDIYSPKGKSNAPVLFFIHGGAWKSGDRSYYPPLGNRYARAGFVTVIPSYRLAPKFQHPAQIEDVAAAFAWTMQHVAEQGGDTNRVYVAGHSAGGHLAALLSLDDHYLAAYQLSPKAIHGVLALSGVYDLSVADGQNSVFGDDPAVHHSASPLFHVKAGAPPFLVTYCQWDYFSLPGQARRFYRALKEAGVKAELVYVPGENHISEMIHVTREDDPTVAAALRFMK